MNITKASFGLTKEGQEVLLYTLTNKNNMSMKIMTYGGIITALQVPDKNGKIGDVALGFNTLGEYLAGHPYFGALIGRFGNRIAKGEFGLDGKTYKLAKNDGDNHLHGGLVGFDKVIWDAVEIEAPDKIGLQLSYLSKDGEEGYPGNLNVTVRYLLTDQNELVIEYEATTDQPTVLNLTQHSYFNLGGEGSGDILDHEMMINADRFTVAGEGLIPTGELRPVFGSAMDFTSPKPIGSRIAEVAGGYDHNYIINSQPGELVLAAKVHEPQSGRTMEVWTTEPGVQLYTGNFLDGSLIGKAGNPYRKHSGFCLETQHYPNSPNQPEFPATRLNPGETYRQTTIYKFTY